MSTEPQPTNPTAADLLDEVYADLRRLAASYMANERPGHTLQPTALVHEAWTRLAGQSRARWNGRTHFLAVCAVAMRRVLVDHARGKQRDKRGAGWGRVTLSETIAGRADGDLGEEDLLDLHRALERLATADARQARIVELRCFGGLTVAEVAESLGISRRTVEGDWTHARAWLSRELDQPSPR